MRARLSLLILLLSLAAAAPAAGAAGVPHGFVGMNVNGPFFDAGVNQAHQLDTMVSSGVESVRVVFDWASAQPAKNGPISFTDTDQIVSLAAQRGLTILPTVIYAPSWDALNGPSWALAIPASDGPYASYLRALVRRYGPHGTFWTQNPGLRKVPIRLWQIWNEPNFTYYWFQQPFAPGYVALLKAAHAAVKSVDPGGRVVLAGMPDFAWKYLAEIYNVHGARKAFDVASVNPYTGTPKHVIKFMQLIRGVMAHNGDRRKPLVASETGWQSSLGSNPSDKFCCQTSERGQARNVKALLPLLGSNRKRLKLLAFYFYTWAGDEFSGAPSFNFAGLFRVSNGQFVAKPAFGPFRRGALALEHCKVKGPLATRCRKAG